jgi:hypothetical protein
LKKYVGFSRCLSPLRGWVCLLLPAVPWLTPWAKVFRPLRGLKGITSWPPSFPVCLFPTAFCLLFSAGPEGRKNLAHRVSRGAQLALKFSQAPAGAKDEGQNASIIAMDRMP